MCTQYVRYIDWTITTPLLLLELLLGTGLPLSDIITVVFMDLVMIVTGLIGSLVTSSYKWGFFVFGVSLWSVSLPNEYLLAWGLAVRCLGICLVGLAI